MSQVCENATMNRESYVHKMLCHDGKKGLLLFVAVDAAANNGMRLNSLEEKNNSERKLERERKWLYFCCTEWTVGASVFSNFFWLKLI